MPRKRTKTDEERKAYKLAWSRANRERLAAQRAIPGRKQAKAEYDRRRYSERAEEIRKRSRDWHRSNKERAVAYSIQWAKDNPDKARQTKRAWKYRNPEMARRVPADGMATPQQIAARVAYYGNRCAYCGGQFEQIDHVIPIARRGTGWPANLRPACRSCNLSKGAKRLAEWRASA